jgi:hypothetical protein
VPRPSSRVARGWHSFVGRMRRLDMGLVALVAGFVLVAPLGGTASSPLAWLARLLRQPPFAAYEAALREAAIKRPSYDQFKLATIAPDTANVEVASFGPPTQPDAVNRKYTMWVSLPSELKAACAGKPDPILALQQILGLPPGAAPDRVVTEITVQRKDLFRPCASGSDLAATSCSFDLPGPTNTISEQAASPSDFNLARFVANQMWTVYRTGFPRTVKSPTDYPYTGIPFTGMGWTYDWAPSSASHVGVTEFVVPGSAEIKFLRQTAPAAFCAKSP